MKLKYLKKKLTSKKIFKTNRPTLQIRSIEPEPYRSIYFKAAYERERRNMFFK